MAYTTLGSAVLNTTLPFSDATVLRCQDTDCVIQWINTTTLSRYYLSDDWSGFTSANQTFSASAPMSSSRKGRVFPDTTTTSIEWVIMPYLTDDLGLINLEVQVFEMTGSNPTSNDFSINYANVLPIDEAYAKMFPMTAGICLVSSLADGSFRLRSFSYAGSGFSNIDVITDTALTTITYPTIFPPGTVFTADLTTIYTSYLDSGLRADYIDFAAISWSQTAKVVADVQAGYAYYGCACSLDSAGTTALVGSYGDNSNTGAAYVLTLDDGTWSQTAKLVADDGATGDFFGFSCSIDSAGTTALVGAYKADISGATTQGAAYVFTLSGGTWSQTAKLVADDGAAGALFGSSCSLDSAGTTALVGAYEATVSGATKQGAAYVFTLSGGTWSQTAKLVADDGEFYSWFGSSCSLNSAGTTALVGAFAATIGSNASAGKAYVFTLDGTWSQTAILIADDEEAYASFGTSCSLNAAGTTALIGAPQDNSTLDTGAAYVFTLDGTWSQTAKLGPDSVVFPYEDHFGSSCSLDSAGTTALIGAANETLGGLGGKKYAGSAYVFKLDGTWSKIEKITASDSMAFDNFGYSCSLDSTGTTALVGAYRESNGAVTTYSGAVYVFDFTGFTTLISTTSGLPTDVTQVYAASVVQGPLGSVLGILHANATVPSVSITNDDPGDFTVSSYTLSDLSLPLVKSNCGFYAYSRGYSFFEIPQSSYIAKVDLTTLSLTINSTACGGDQKVAVQLGSDVVNLAITVTSNGLSGMTLGSAAFGPDNTMPNLAANMAFLNRIRNTPISPYFWTASIGSGGTQTFSKYLLTTAPPQS